MARQVFRLAWVSRPAPPEPLTILDQKLVGGQPAVGGSRPSGPGGRE